MMAAVGMEAALRPACSGSGRPHAPPLPPAVDRSASGAQLRGRHVSWPAQCSGAFGVRRPKAWMTSVRAMPIVPLPVRLLGAWWERAMF